MSTPFRTLALIGKYQSPDVAESVLSIARFLRDRGLAVLIEQGTASSIGGAHDFPVASYEHIGASADLAVVIGGDGTMLHTARRLIEHGVPLVGVNLGRLGFLTDIARCSATERLAEILDGAFTAEDRFMLDVEVLRGGARVFHTLALNDVVVNKGELGRMIEFELSIDEEFVYTQRSDGMIVSTPTGSTAYALSAGGPIMHPKLDAIVIVPMYPHTLSSRPIVVDGNSELKVVVSPNLQIYPQVSCDGQNHFTCAPGDTLTIRKKVQKLQLIHPVGHNYYEICRTKLGWGSRLGGHE